MHETPFNIHIPSSSLELLQSKLSLITFPDELEDAGLDYGAPLSSIKRLVERWKEGYDWRKYEKELNDRNNLPQFRKVIAVEGFGELDVHYLHKKSSRGDGAIPLLFIHGWPGSFLEVKKILPLLTDPENPTDPGFHVVAPSLPGFGFSSAPKKRGFALSQYAEVLHKLVSSLGYEEYVVQGGDWGAYIGKKMAELYGGRHVKAWHTNYPRAAIAAKPPSLLTSVSSFSLTYPIRSLTYTMKTLSRYLIYTFTPLSTGDRAALARTHWFVSSGRGYSAIQRTAPQTVGYALADSPVGLLAWIYEKLEAWSDSPFWTDDEVLTWVSIYWFSTAGPAASLRIYYERQHSTENDDVSPAPNVPMGFSFFPKEIHTYPRLWWNDPNLIFESDHTDEGGGHFAAYEKPNELADDLRRMMFGRESKLFGVVSGRTGY